MTRDEWRRKCDENLWRTSLGEGECGELFIR